MPEIYRVGIGLLLFPILFGFLVDPLLRLVTKPVHPPNSAIADKWNKLTSQKHDDEHRQLLQLKHQIKEPGFWLGVFERILFFSAIWLQSLEVIGGWLAFKVASKWAIYEHIIAFPQSLVGVNIDFLIARRQWGAQRLMRFLIGTIANVLLAFAGVLVGQLLV